MKLGFVILCCSLLVSLGYCGGIEINHQTGTIKLPSGSGPTANGEIGYNGTSIQLRQGGVVQPLGDTIGSLAYGLTAPDSTYKKCDGQVLSQSTYASLYSKVGILPAFTPTVRSVLPTNLVAMAYSSSLGLYVGVGSGGSVGQTFWTSLDGLNWNSVNSAGLPSTPTDVIWCSGLSKFVAANGSTNIWSSSDGVTWIPKATGADANLSFLAYSGTTLLAAGASNSDNSIQNVWTSTDGSAWTKRNLSGNPNSAVTAVHWSSGMSLFFAGFANGNIQTSSDGATWNARTSNIASQINQFDSYASLVVAVGNSGVISSSPDGTTWTARTTQTAQALNGVTYNSALDTPWMASGTSCILTSTNGTTWVTQIGNITGRAPISWSSTDSKYVAAGSAGYVATSTDNVTWTARVSALPTSVAFSTVSPTSTYVSVHANGNIQSSVDSGATWATRTSNAGANQLNHVVYVGGSINLYIVAGAGGIINTSPDGTTWTARTSNFSSQNANALAYKTSSDLVVCVGNGGKISTSTDGITWTARTSNTAKDLQGIAWNGTVWCAVGNSQTVLTSSDGTTWTKQAPTGLSNQNVSWITSDGSKFYAIQSTQVVWQSTDGIAWTPYPCPITPTGVNWINSKLVAHSNQGDIATSTDGKVWTLVVNSRSITSWTRAYTINGRSYFTQGVAGYHYTTNGQNFSGHYNTTVNDMCYSASQDKLLAVGNTGLVMYSTTGGVTWTQVYALSGAVSAGAQACAYSPSLDKFVIGSATAGIYVSSDGISWTQKETSDSFIGNVAGSQSFNTGMWSSAKSLFIMVGGSGTVFTSSDADTWTARSVSPGYTSINGLCYNTALDKFVAVGNFGQVHTSTNGTSWSLSNTGLTYGGLAAVGSLESDGFVAFANQGHMLTSTDGVTWTYTQAIPSTTTSGGKSLRLDGGIFWPMNGSNSYGGLLAYTNDGNTFQTFGMDQTASPALSHSGITYDSTRDAIVVAASAGTPGGVYFVTMTKVYNRNTHFALPRLQNTWIKATN